MDLQLKLNLLSEAAGFDMDEATQADVCATAGRPLPNGRVPQAERHIALLTRSDGRRVPILKVLQTSACAKDCYYCPFRAGRDFRRTAFKPDELASATDQLYRAGRIQGLFLSSGIVGRGEYTQEQIVKTAAVNAASDYLTNFDQLIERFHVFGDRFRPIIGARPPICAQIEPNLHVQVLAYDAL